MAKKKTPAKPRKSIAQQVIDALNEFIESGELARVLEKLPHNPPKIKPKLCPPRPEKKPKAKGSFTLTGPAATYALRDWASYVLMDDPDGNDHSLVQEAANGVTIDPDVKEWGDVVEWMRHVAWLSRLFFGPQGVSVTATGLAKFPRPWEGGPALYLAVASTQNKSSGWMLEVEYDYGNCTPGSGTEFVPLIEKLLAHKDT